MTLLYSRLRRLDSPFQQIIRSTMLLDHISQNLYGLDNGYLAMIDLGIIALLVENLVYILVWLWLNVYWVWFWFSERFLRMVYEPMIDLGCRWVCKVMSISVQRLFALIHMLSLLIYSALWRWDNTPVMERDTSTSLRRFREVILRFHLVL